MYTVVTVDDETLIKQSLKLLIEAVPGFRVTGEAEDGAEALALVKELQPDLVVTDICMPVMDGIELMEELGKLHSRAKIIVLSGYAEFEYARQALQYGVVDYIVKPVQPEPVAAALNKARLQLEGESDFSRKRNEWLWLCKKEGTLLSERIWLMDEEGVAAGAERIGRMLREARLDDEAVRVAYSDLLAIVEGQLMERNGGQLRLNAPFHPAKEEPERLPGLFASRMLEWVQQYRKTRNWNAHLVVNQAVKEIQSHFADGELSLQWVSAKIGVGVSYLSRCFKEETGVSFSDYLTDLRMQKAKALLHDPCVRTYEVAHSVGYRDYPHFARTFKRLFGFSATDYRKRMLS